MVVAVIVLSVLLVVSLFVVVNLALVTVSTQFTLDKFVAPNSKTPMLDSVSYALVGAYSFIFLAAKGGALSKIVAGLKTDLVTRQKANASPSTSDVSAGVAIAGKVSDVTVNGTAQGNKTREKRNKRRKY